MKKFKFKLDTVLKERKKVEDLRLREWTMAKRILQMMSDQLAEMEGRLTSAFNESTEAAAAPGSHSGLLTSMESFIKGTKIRIEWKRNEIERATKLTEKARLNYVQARQKREAIEKLKERRLAEYREGLRKAELKKLDDIYIMNGAARARMEEEEATHE